MYALYLSGEIRGRILRLHSFLIFDSRKQADSVNYELSSIDVKLTSTPVLDGQ